MRNYLQKLVAIVMALSLGFAAEAQDVKPAAKVQAPKALTAAAKENLRIDAQPQKTERMSALRQTKTAALGLPNMLRMQRPAFKPSLLKAGRKAPARVLANGVELGGMVTYPSAQYGIYEVEADGSLTPFVQGSDYTGSAGVLAGDTYIIQNLVSYYGYVQSNTVSFVNAETWEVRSQIDLGDDLSFSALELACDPTTGNVYGCCYNEDASGLELVIVDYDALHRETIAAMSNQYAGMAFNAEGQLFAVTPSGTLLAVDKETGAETVIGETGVTNTYLVSAVIDQKTGDMYFSEADLGSIYRINTATAEATLVCTFANEEELQGLFIPAPKAEDGAPAAVENLAAHFEGPSLDGTVTFTMPATTFDGEPLSGLLTYRVLFNDEVVATENAQMGADITVSVTVAEAGNYEIMVIVANETGDSPKAKTKLYIGEDYAAAVQNVAVAYADGKMTLTWDATTPVNGGYIDMAKVTYNVTRILGADETVVATGLTECRYEEAFTEPDGLAKLSYAVTVLYNGEESLASASNQLVVGSGIVPPYTEDFEGEDPLAMFTVVDGNADGKVWTVVGEGEDNRCARISYNTSLDMDDWLITAPVKMKAATNYEISFRARAASSSYPENVEAFITTSADPATMQVLKQIASVEGVTNTWETYGDTFCPEADGQYFVAIHGCSTPDQYYLYVDDIAVSAGAMAGSPAMPEVTAEAAADGSLIATLTIVAPDKDDTGKALESLAKVEVERGGAVVKTFDTVAPGQTLTFVDVAVEAGNNTWTVTAYNALGAGKPATATAYVGFDVPAVPTDIAIVETAPGKVKITWTAPATDVNGKPISGLTYSIINMNTYQRVVTDLEATEYEFAAVDEDEQDFVEFAVGASNEAGEGDFDVTPILLVGRAYDYPYSESFAEGSMGSAFLTSVTGNAQWRLFTPESFTTPIPDADGNDGFVGMKGSALYDSGSLITAKISLAEAAAPILQFSYMPMDTDNANTLEVSVKEVDDEDWTVVLPAFEMGEGAAQGDWATAKVNLGAYKGKVIQLKWTSVIMAYTYTMLDAIAVKDNKDYDLVASAFAAPASVSAGTEFNVVVSVLNDGAQDVDSYAVELYRDGAKVQEKAGLSLANGAKADVAFAETLSAVVDGATYKAVVVLAADQDNTNNETAEALVTVKHPALPTVADLDAAPGASGVTLTWSAPAIDAADGAVTEDFENAESFSQEVEGWTFVDEDGLAVGGVQDLDIPGITAGTSAMAWYVADNSDTSKFNSSWEAHSGNKFMSNMFNYQGGANSDWMISPELSGEAQTISFFARSYTVTYGAEKFEFLYSTTDMDLASFQSVATQEVPAEWTEYSYDVPEGARYFAIRCISQDNFMLFVDDVTYTPVVPEILGYNIYRDGVKLNDAPVAGTTYTDATVGEGDYTYAVTVVYAQGESKASNTVSIITTGISNAAADGAAIRAYTLDGRAANPAALRRGVYVVDGKKVVVE